MSAITNANPYTTFYDSMSDLPNKEAAKTTCLHSFNKGLRDVEFPIGTLTYIISSFKGPDEIKWKHGEGRIVKPDIVTIKFGNQEIGTGTTRERGLPVALDNAIENAKKNISENKFH